MYKGIGMNVEHSFEEIGLQFSITEKEVRNIIAKSFRKLKNQK